MEMSEVMKVVANWYHSNFGYGNVLNLHGVFSIEREIDKWETTFCLTDEKFETEEEVIAVISEHARLSCLLKVDDDYNDYD